jgi:hypothetical protein
MAATQEFTAAPAPLWSSIRCWRTRTGSIFWPIHDVGAVSLLVTIAGVAGAPPVWWMSRGTRANFLFERPAAFWIAPRKTSPALQAAE